MNALDSITQDLAYAVRTLRKNLAFSVAALLTLALGIGANTAMFTVIRGVLLKPLAFRDPDRLVQVSGGATTVRFDEMQSRSYSGIAAFVYVNESLPFSGMGEPEVLRGTHVTSNFLKVLGVEPILGRDFVPDEDNMGGARVALISSELWQRRFQGDPSIVGKYITLSAAPYLVIGVLPPRFQFPASDIDVWVTRPKEYVNTLSPMLSVIGRLNPGVTLDQASAELAVTNQQYAKAHPGMLDSKPGKIERVTPLKDRVVANVRSTLWLLFGAVGIVLLIACANVASLLLARAASRSREFAVRAAVGAGRGRLMSQLLCESALLGICGGALGLLLARLSLTALSRASALDLPRVDQVHIDGWVLGFSMTLSLLTSLLFGLAPSISASRPDLISMLRGSGESATTAPSSHRRWWPGIRRVLVSGQLALSMVLLIGATLLIESIAKIAQVDPGFNPSHVLTMRISLPESRYETSQKKATFFHDLIERVDAIPGMRNAAVTMTAPLSTFARTPVQRTDQPLAPLNQRPLGLIENITPDYFRTFEIPLKRGRQFTDRDDLSSPMVTIVNEKLARELWPAYPAGIDPVGQRIFIGSKTVPVEVVGVTADYRQGLSVEPWPSVFRPYSQTPTSAVFAVRTQAEPLSYLRAITAAIASIDPDQPVSNVQTMDDLYTADGGPRRVVLTLLAVFAGVALILAVIGLYGVIAHSVVQRTQELGIRRALGAQSGQILRLKLGQGLAMSVAGVVAGGILAAMVTKFLEGWLYGVKATDPWTFAGVAVLFVAVALAASYAPARRAARVDPMVALRSQ
jgi:predicted permease